MRNGNCKLPWRSIKSLQEPWSVDKHALSRLDKQSERAANFVPVEVYVNWFLFLFFYDNHDSLWLDYNKIVFQSDTYNPSREILTIMVEYMTQSSPGMLIKENHLQIKALLKSLITASWKDPKVPKPLFKSYSGTLQVGKISVCNPLLFLRRGSLDYLMNQYNIYLNSDILQRRNYGYGTQQYETF